MITRLLLVFFQDFVNQLIGHLLFKECGPEILGYILYLHTQTLPGSFHKHNDKDWCVKCQPVKPGARSCMNNLKSAKPHLSGLWKGCHGVYYRGQHIEIQANSLHVLLLTHLKQTWMNLSFSCHDLTFTEVLQSQKDMKTFSFSVDVLGVWVES